MEPIQIVGIKELDDQETSIINKLSNEYYEKISRSLKGETSIVIHIKTHKTTGKRKKYDLRIRVNNPSVLFESGSTTDWDLPRTLHKAFKDVERGIQHKLRTDSSYRKSYE